MEGAAQVDVEAVPGIAVGDRVVIDDGVPAKEEYLTVGRIQTTDDVTGFDLGTRDRIWFTTSLRFDHDAAAVIQEVTLTSKREGVHYNVTSAATGEITLLAGQFTSPNPVVASYRADPRFGRFRNGARRIRTRVRSISKPCVWPASTAAAST